MGVMAPKGRVLYGILAATPFPVLGRTTATLYLVAALVLLLSGRRGGFPMQALVGIVVDITAAALAIHALPDAASGIALMLLFNVGAAALFLPLRYGLGAAAGAGLALGAEFVWTQLEGNR